jgi:hypothetical protein
MKKLVLVIALVTSAYFAYARHERVTERANETASTTVDRPGSKASNTQVEGIGVVSRILPDDNHGSRHQRFILRLQSGQTLLVAHNIDFAQRIDDLKEGDTVEYSGEYEWNPKGGVVHWTHRDPSGQHVAGWLKHDGRVFQ